MKLTITLLTFAVISASATGYSQEITLNVTNASLVNVFRQIEKQTGYSFFYDNSLLKKVSPVTISIKRKSVREALEKCLENQPLQFNIIDKVVVIKEKKLRAAGFVKIPEQAEEPEVPLLVDISGVVTDQDGKPLKGASVRLKNSTLYTTTDDKGMFKISGAEPNAILVVSFIGYKSEEVSVKGEGVLQIKLKQEEKVLDEVVSVGYGTVRRGDLTGSVSSISQSDLEKVSAATFDLKIQGRVPGVMVTQTSSEPGGNATVRIRGGNSISGNNEPLYVIDGYSMPTESEAGGTGDGQGLNVLAGINPDDIESIQILKDASAAAIYGARGANGVVIITTKRGSIGKAKIAFDSQIGLNEVINTLDLGSASQYAQYQNDYNESRGMAPIYNGSSARFPKPEEAGEGTDWLNAILRNGSMQRHQLSVSGGNNSMRYNISGQYYNERGVVIGSKMNRGNIRVNLDNNFSEKFSLATTINLTNASNNRVQPGALRSNMLADAIYLALRANPIVPADATGTGEFGGATYGDSDGNFFENPIFLATQKKDLTQNEDYFASLRATYKINKDLRAVVNVGSTRRYSARRIYYPRSTALGFQNNGYAYSNSYKSLDYLMEGYLNYNKSFGQFLRVDATAGLSQQMNEYLVQNVRVSGFPNDITDFEALQFGTTLYNPSSQRIRRALRSYYMRSNFTFLQGRYLLTLTGRADGSSVFSANNKWGIFPSGALAWRVSNEPFFQPLKSVISDFKIRSSYGITGSQAISPLGSLAIISATNYVSGGQLISGTSKTTMGNTNLKWEQTAQLNLGVDISVFFDRIRLTADYYNKKTSNLLQTLSIPTSSGFSSVVGNQGSIQNKGFEFALTVDAIKQRNFSWTANGNISFNTNRALDLGGNIIYGLGAASAPVFLRSLPMTIVKEGYASPVYYGLVAERLIQESDFDANGKPTFATYNNVTTPGQWLYRDVDGNGIINAEDRQVIGNPVPKFIYGFTNEFKYRNFQASIFLQGVYGNDIFNLGKAYLSSGLPYLNKLSDYFENRWTPENPTNDINYTAVGTVYDNMVPGNYYIEDGSYLRLKNVTISYNVPLKNKLITNLQLGLSGTNLFTITDYSGFDPEVGIYGGNNLLPSVDLGSYPRARFYQFNIKLSL